MGTRDGTRQFCSPECHQRFVHSSEQEEEEEGESASSVTQAMEASTLGEPLDDQDFAKALYKAYAHAPNDADGNRPRPEIYRKVPASSVQLDKEWLFHYDAGRFGGHPDPVAGKAPGDRFQHRISYTTMGDRGPLVLMLHGVPTNKRQHQPVQRMLAPFCRTIAIDMNGMGKSSMPLNWFNRDVGHGDHHLTEADLLATPHEELVQANTDRPGREKWGWWRNDAKYIAVMMQTLYPDEKFFFYADDWGGGISMHYAATYPNRLLGHILQNPIGKFIY